MTIPKATIRRLSTGVSGLDEVLGGGLPEFSFNLIGGSPGSGKTTLAHQIMFALASAERPALYFTVLGEPPLKMLRYQQQFDFFDHERVNQCVHFLYLADRLGDGGLDSVLTAVFEAVARVKPALVFVDSFRSVTTGRHDASGADLQQFIQQLSVMMSNWEATTFLIGEYASQDETNPVFTVADGLIWLYQTSQGNSVARKIDVRKMRGQRTVPGLHTFRITSEGISVFAPPRVLETEPPKRARTTPRARVAMGNAILDEMLGGGLPEGYSLLVAGPSGAGKSILAAAFLAEGARLGETAVIALFEQRATFARGAFIAGLIEAGQVGVVDTGAADLSVDEVAGLLIAEVKRLNASRVVIDSLSGFELALAPTFSADFRESLSRLIVALARTGATVLMTSEMEDRYDELRFSPYGSAFMTDAIVILRYIEVESRLKRVLAVVKVRGSAHSDELRLFDIDEHGIQIGASMPEHEGLLGGRPRRVTDVAALSDVRGRDVANPVEHL